MASQKTCTSEYFVKQALEELKKNQLIDDYGKNEAEITEVLKNSALTEEVLTNDIAYMIDDKNIWQVEQEMSTIIGSERVELIKKSFAIETYIMNVVTKRKGQSAVRVHRDGEVFVREIMLMTINDQETATVVQWASLVIELFFFVFSCVGINVDLNASEMRAIVQEVEGFAQDPKFMKALIKFLEAWNESGSTVWGKAKAIFLLLKEFFSDGFFWKIAKLIINNLSWWQKAKALTKVAVLIVAAINTGGAALIARIVIALHRSDRLAEKIANIITFSDMKKTMETMK